MSRARAEWSRWRWIIAVSIAVAVLLLWLSRDRPQPAAADPSSLPGMAPRPSRGDDRVAPSAASTAGLRGTATHWPEVVSGAREAAAKGDTAVQSFVIALQAGLDALPHAERVRTVTAFLASGEDVAFGDRFRLGPGGFLAFWPTLRVALLDYLAQRDGAAAREVAAAWLATVPVEPGEWTVAFRELTRGRAYADWDPQWQARVRDFLGNEDWRRGARRAWLEGFDIIVAGRATPLLGELSDLTARPGPEGFAAFLAADRLMVADARGVLASLDATPDLFAANPRVRAGLFARADPRDPVQVEGVENYLRRADLREDEAAHFAELFPFHGSAEASTLLSAPAHRSMAEMVARDRAAVDALARWEGQAALLRWRPLLLRARDRVQSGLVPLAAGKGAAK